MDRIDLPEDFKLWGYSLSELRQMRDYWESTHYSAVQGEKKESCTEHTCCNYQTTCCKCGKLKPNAVEEKIHKIAVEWGTARPVLYDLVRLAREGYSK